MKKDEKSIVLAQVLSCLAISLVAGIIIGFFQVGLRYLFVGIENIFQSSIETATPIIIYSLLSFIAVIGIYVLLHFLKIGIGKGGILLNRYLNNGEVKWYEYPLLMLGFFISVFAGIPVGAVEVGQTVGIAISARLISRGEIEDEDLLDASSSAGFAAMFLSPLAGVAHALETRKWKFTLAYFLKVIGMITIMVLCAFLVRLIFGLQNEFLLRIAEFETFSWKSLYTYAFMGVVIAISAFILNISTLKLNKYLEKKKLSDKVSNILTVVLICVAVVCTFVGLKGQWYTFALAGYDGSRIMNLYDHFKIGLLIGTVFLWAFYILAIPHSKLIGGKTVPVIALGSLLGIVFAWHGRDVGFMRADETCMMASVAMFAFYGVVYKRPVTAFCLAITFSKWTILPYELIPLILAIIPGYLLMMFAKVPTLNEACGVSESLIQD